jgi:hypothetical protein
MSSGIAVIASEDLVCPFIFLEVVDSLLSDQDRLLGFLVQVFVLEMGTL